MRIAEKINRITSSYPEFKKYFYNTSWMISEKILRLATAVFVGAYVARYLGPDQFGLLSYTISLVSLFAGLSALGLEQILIKKLIQTRDDEKSLLGTSFVLRIFGTFLVLIALTLIIKLSNNDEQSAILIYVIAGSMFFEAFSVIDFYFQSQVKSKYVVWSQMISFVSLSIFRIILVYIEAPLIWFGVAYVLDFFVLALGLVWFYSQKSNFFNWRFNKEKAKELLKNSWPLILASISVGLYMKVDQVMIKWMLGNTASGNYGVAVRLSEIWNFIPVAICGSLFPSIINSKLADEKLYKKRLQLLYDLMVALSVSIAIPMTFLSGFIVQLLYGNAYQEAGPILAIYIWSSVFVFLGVATSKHLINENLQVLQMIGLFIAALLNIILNFILIKVIGLYGSAISTLISYSFATYFVLLFSKRTRPVFKDCTRSLNVIILFKRLILQVKNS